MVHHTDFLLVVKSRCILSSTAMTQTDILYIYSSCTVLNIYVRLTQAFPNNQMVAASEWPSTIVHPRYFCIVLYVATYLLALASSPTVEPEYYGHLATNQKCPGFLGQLLY